jgi:hypothetical protein
MLTVSGGYAANAICCTGLARNCRLPVSGSSPQSECDKLRDTLACCSSDWPTRTVDRRSGMLTVSGGYAANAIQLTTMPNQETQ